MVGVLVHVDRKNRRGAGKAVRMVRRPLVDQPAEAFGPGEDYPAGTASERLRHGSKLTAPGRDAAEITLERAAELGRRLLEARGRVVALPAERLEIDFVQDHRASCD